MSRSRTGRGIGVACCMKHASALPAYNVFLFRLCLMGFRWFVFSSYVCY